MDFQTIVSAYRMHAELGISCLRCSDLELSEYVVLLASASFDRELSLETLGHSFGLPASTIKRHALSLEDRGMALSLRSEDDRRKRGLRSTDTGRRVIFSIDEVLASRVECLYEDQSAEVFDAMAWLWPVFDRDKALHGCMKNSTVLPLPFLALTCAVSDAVQSASAACSMSSLQAMVLGALDCGIFDSLEQGAVFFGIDERELDTVLGGMITRGFVLTEDDDSALLLRDGGRRKVDALYDSLESNLLQTIPFSTSEVEDEFERTFLFLLFFC